MVCCLDMFFWLSYAYAHYKPQYFSIIYPSMLAYNKSMQKSIFAQYFKKPHFWVCLAAGILLVATLILIITRQENSTEEAKNTLSPSGLYSAATPADEKGTTVQILIKNYELKGHSINTFRSQEKRAEIYTGAFLTEWNDYYAALDGTNNWTIVSEANVTRLKILEYSDEKITALACLSENELELDQKGKLVRQLPAVNFAGAYIFVYTEKTWKLANFINVSDPARARSIYAALPQELQQLSGSIGPLLQISCPNT